mmetsp:Transcript_92370/g.247114  ORF Transcript_92370/g.247114 Transcript_92370/m.247114 type:complete len:204 (+) Transcript_92370:1162-1773(+)
MGHLLLQGGLCGGQDLGGLSMLMLDLREEHRVIDHHCEMLHTVDESLSELGGLRGLRGIVVALGGHLNEVLDFVRGCGAKLQLVPQVVPLDAVRPGLVQLVRLGGQGGHQHLVAKFNHAVDDALHGPLVLALRELAFSVGLPDPIDVALVIGEQKLLILEGQLGDLCAVAVLLRPRQKPGFHFLVEKLLSLFDPLLNCFLAIG